MSRKEGLPHLAGSLLAEAGRSGGVWRALGAKARAHGASYAAVAAIVALATVLRVLWPDVAEFKIDEVQPLALADQIWVQRRLALTWGVSSTGLPETPLIGYLLALPRAISSDPRAAVVFLGLLDSVAVLLTYLGVRRFAGEQVAMATAASYAACPWAVMFSRKTWSEIVPLFAVIFLWAAYEVVVHRKPAWALAFFPLVAVQVQNHVMGVLYLPALLVTVLLFWPRWRNRYALCGMLLGILVLSPYVWVLARQWGATQALLKQNAGQGLAFDGRALTYGLWFASGASLTALMGRSVILLRHWERALRAINLVTAALLLWGTAGSLQAVMRRRPGWERQALLLIWLGGPLVPLVLMRPAMGMHYLLVLVPALFVAIGSGWAHVARSQRRALVLGGRVGLGAILAVQVGAVLTIYNGVVQHPTEGGFGWPLGLWRQVQGGVGARVAAEGWRELHVLGTDDAPWSSERVALDYLLQRRVRLRYVGRGGHKGLLVPAQGQALALVIAADDEMLQALGRFGEEKRRWAVPGHRWGIRLYRLRGHDQAEVVGPAALPAAAAFDNGMRLLGAGLPNRVQQGGRLRVWTYWWYTGQATGAGHTDTVFVHLLDSTGRRWAQSDGFALCRSEWRPGETLIYWFSLALPPDQPPGDCSLYVGMYSWRDMARANVVDESGRPVADGVRLGPIRVVPPVRPERMREA